jgi:Type I phosphodiesterase / nucleotide pyrophosphatase
MNGALGEVDTMIGSLLAGLNERNLTDIVNVIIVVCLYYLCR